MLHGMVFKKEAEGDVTSVKDAKIAVFSCPFDSTVTETKVGNALLITTYTVYYVACCVDCNICLKGFLPIDCTLFGI